MSATELGVTAKAAPLVVPLDDLVPLIKNCPNRRTLIRAGKHPNPHRRLKMRKIGGKWHSNENWLKDWIELLDY